MTAIAARPALRSERDCILHDALSMHLTDVTLSAGAKLRVFLLGCPDGRGSNLRMRETDTATDSRGSLNCSLLLGGWADLISESRLVEQRLTSK